MIHKKQQTGDILVKILSTTGITLKVNTLFSIEPSHTNQEDLKCNPRIWTYTQLVFSVKAMSHDKWIKNSQVFASD